MTSPYASPVWGTVDWANDDTWNHSSKASYLKPSRKASARYLHKLSTWLTNDHDYSGCPLNSAPTACLESMPQRDKLLFLLATSKLLLENEGQWNLAYVEDYAETDRRLDILSQAYPELFLACSPARRMVRSKLSACTDSTASADQTVKASTSLIKLPKILLQADRQLKAAFKENQLIKNSGTVRSALRFFQDARAMDTVEQVQMLADLIRVEATDNVGESSRG